MAGAGEVLAHKPAVLGTAWDEHIACIVRAHKPGPKVYVHLGTPKTGTTALQEFFAQNILELRHAGIDYFREFIQGTGDQKHQRIFQGMSQQNNELIDRIKEHIRHESAQGAHTFLISSEGYYNYVQECGPSYMQCIRELAKEFSVCLVVFLRPQCYFLESYYRQCLRNPKVEDRPAYCSDLSIETFAALPWMSNQLDYARNIQFFMDNMGGASLALVRYSSQALKSFLRFLCVPHDLATRITRTTPKLSLNRNATELLRVLNRVLSPESRNRVIQILEQTASCSSISRDAFFASPALMDRVTLQHSDSNRLLSMMFWGREELFPGLALNPDAAWSPPEIHGELLPGLLAPLLARLSA
ncbi:hypothetical protein DGI_4037 (plasmid) [Megalodesulfovibrio gigas DSM 1382 = ATCC 19364]|uniref:Uncharacterized protein n=1 Tax=Megalodesulfovibrio gigas (strain ATCC 19364 / DSM 1382 / NCIMB 9332 / VKM B-1759) TaxID=1121448 RepID=T2GG91_MEGG1|nr:hypothetical protein DGI_4037 [Megalodesulfovibrio gigas DSM 1382 = ATCC 19364]